MGSPELLNLEHDSAGSLELLNLEHDSTGSPELGRQCLNFESRFVEVDLAKKLKYMAAVVEVRRKNLDQPAQTQPTGKGF